MFRDLNWLPFTKNFQYHTCLMMYKALNDFAPEYISSQFSNIFETHSRHLRPVDNELLRVPYSRTCYFENSFTVDGAKQWNNLPVNLRTLPNLNSLKKSLKSYLQNLKMYVTIIAKHMCIFPAVLRLITFFSMQYLSWRWQDVTAGINIPTLNRPVKSGIHFQVYIISQRITFRKRQACLRPM